MICMCGSLEETSGQTEFSESTLGKALTLQRAASGIRGILISGRGGPFAG